MATPLKKAAQAPAVGFAFGDMGNYSAGGGLPEGDYIWKDLTVQMYQAQKQDGTSAGPARLGVMITLLPLTGGEERTQFYSMGSKAHESFAPNPETGKGIIPIPGGPASRPNNSTNWAILLKSMYDSGLPQGIFTDDCSVLDGTHVHMANVPEPAERAGYAAKTGEAAEERKAGTIAVVTEIKDDGKPWEGSGGVPEQTAAAKPNGKPAAKAAAAPVAARPVARAVAVPAPAQNAEPDDLATVVSQVVTDILMKNPNGCPKLLLRTSTFKAIKDGSGQEAAQSAMETYFSSDTALNSILGDLGYAVKGPQVVAA